MITFDVFTGEFPRNIPSMLPPGGAQYAQDCDFLSGDLRGVRERAGVPGIPVAGVKSLFVYDSLVGSWYSWNRDVDAVMSPVVNDTYSRFYWTDGTGVYVSRGDIGSGGEPSSTNTYRVGVPQPAAAPVIQSNLLTFPGATSVSFRVANEYVDGTQDQIAPRSATNTATTATSKTWVCSTPSTPTSTSTTSSVTTTTPGNAAGTTTQTTSTVTRVFANQIVLFDILKVDGTTVTAILRPDASKSTWPSDFGTFGGNIVTVGGTITIKVWASVGSTDSRAYVYTYVNAYSEEGPPSEASLIETQQDGVVVLRYAAPPATHAPIGRLRLYRTATGQSTSFLFVGEYAVDSSYTITDNVPGADLGEPLSTLGYFPPESGLKGLCALPNGILAAFKNNEVHFCVPYLPYAWKTGTILTFPNRVVGICPTEGGLYVTTTAHPYLVAGVDPESMVAQKIPAVQAGVSKGSICNMGPYVVWASHDGLVMARGLDASMDASFRFFTREVWRERYASKLSLMRINAHDGNLVVWFTDGTPGFLVRFEEENSSLTRLTDPIYAAFVHPTADALYVASTSAVFQFKGSPTTKPFVWWSKDFILPKPGNFGAIQLVGTGTVTVDVYADGVLKQTVPMTLSETGDAISRLISGFLSRRWSFKITGTANTALTIGHVVTSLAELQNV